jgi:hypothetical protein
VSKRRTGERKRGVGKVGTGTEGLLNSRRAEKKKRTVVVEFHVYFPWGRVMGRNRDHGGYLNELGVSGR